MIASRCGGFLHAVTVGECAQDIERAGWTDGGSPRPIQTHRIGVFCAWKSVTLIVIGSSLTHVCTFVKSDFGANVIRAVPAGGINLVRPAIAQDESARCSLEQS